VYESEPKNVLNDWGVTFKHHYTITMEDNPSTTISDGGFQTVLRVCQQKVEIGGRTSTKHCKEEVRRAVREWHGGEGIKGWIYGHEM
jgi:hypothetical protein